MKFLFDAQLPAKLARALDAGHDAVHTSQLPDGTHTSDAEIARFADAENRIVVTEDADFRESHLITGSPPQLLVVETGNITNAALLNLLRQHLDAVVSAYADADFVELRAGELTIHQRSEG